MRVEKSLRRVSNRKLRAVVREWRGSGGELYLVALELSRRLTAAERELRSAYKHSYESTVDEGRGP